MSPPPPGPRVPAWALVLAMLAAQAAAATYGSFRADDWLNLERGAHAWTPEGALEVWTTLNAFGLYRPLVDLWHGAGLRLFGMSAPPMMMVLIANLALQAWMLARLVRVRGGSRETAALAAAALLAQPNTYAWSVLWVSNATGALMLTASLLTLLLHARAVRRIGRGDGAGITLAAMSLVMVIGALCKEDLVLLPALLIVLELARGPRLSPSERRASVAATGAVVAIAAAYAAFRLIILPTPQGGDDRYHLRLGPHVLRNAAFFAAHLAALPVVVWLLARWRMGREPRLPDAAAVAIGTARREAAAGFAWAAITCTLYLPISGRPSYGYLLAPAVGIAYAVAQLLTSRAIASGRPLRRAPAAALWVHAVLALALTAGALYMIQWHRFGPLERLMVRELASDAPRLPRNARIVFIDAGGSETPAGRTIFNLIASSQPDAFLRMALARRDVSARTIVAAGASADSLRIPDADAVYVVREGAIIRPGR